MELVHPAIFRAYDIRGVYGTDFDAAFAQRLGRHLAAHLSATVLVVGRDGRPSGPELAHAVADGFLHAGTRVIDVGEVSSPQFYWAVRTLGAQGGIMVTASHNPADQNGFKAVAMHGGLVDVIGGHELRQIYDSHGGAHRPGGKLEAHDVVPGYAAAVSYAASWQGGVEIPCAIQAPRAITRVLERLGPVAPDQNLAARFDADGDRIMFFDHGESVPPDLLLVMLVQRLQFSSVVADIRCSRIMAEWCGSHGVPLIRSRVGRLYMTQAMHRSGAAVGGELSGHFYWKSFGGMESPELTLLTVMGVIRESRISLNELIAPYRKYFRSDELSVPIHDHKQAAQVIGLLEQRYRGCPMDRTDGLSVDCDDFWFNVRPSNTEAVLRLVVESKRKDLLERRIQEVRGLLH
ncbi:MAG TPA: hypothetical protein VMU12_02135 [Candidatus Paceibacterota bacterium]|nr:hypothetical protein [Candidatus Paceibacterota bacterium]